LGEVAPAPPLLLSRAGRRAADVFPVEITDIRSAYRVLRGDDPLADVTVRPADLRAALERDLRGRLLRLRQGFVSLAADPGALAGLARDTAPSVVVLLRCALVLAGAQLPPTRADVVATAGLSSAFLGASSEVSRTSAMGRGAYAHCFAGYIAAWLIRHIDNLSPETVHESPRPAPRACAALLPCWPAAVQPHPGPRRAGAAPRARSKSSPALGRPHPEPY
jgi:hypothetical protein